jgi:hypothetical protein
MSPYTILAITCVAVFALVTVWRAVSGAHFNRALRAYGSTADDGSWLAPVTAESDLERRRSA